MLWPSVPYRVEDVPGSGADIVIPTLVPNEQVTINYLYFPPLTYQNVNRNVQSNEGFARVVVALPTPQPSRFVLLILRALVLVGCATVLYAVLLGAGRIWRAL